MTQQYGKAMDEESCFVLVGGPTESKPSIGPETVISCFTSGFPTGVFVAEDRSRTAAHGSPELSLAHGRTEGGAKNSDPKG